MLKMREFALLACLSLAVHLGEGAFEPCTKVGPRCSWNKKEVEMCVSTIEQPQVIQDCAASRDVCSDDGKGKVQCARGGEDPEKKFKCREKGEFPDIIENSDRSVICGDGLTVTEECTCPDGHSFLPEPGLPCVKDQRQIQEVNCRPGLSGYVRYLDGVESDYYYYCFSSVSATVFNLAKQDSSNTLYGITADPTKGKVCTPTKEEKPEKP